jgi:galactose oxidase
VQVLTWSAFSPTNFGGNTGAAKTVTGTYDPASGAVSSATVTVTNHDMFCPGITMLGSGDIVVTGGSNAEKTSIFDVLTNKWRPGPNMIKPRGYQASALLSTGEVRCGTTSGH